MSSTKFCLLIIVCMPVAALSAQAQAAPPIKPGLWELRMEHDVNGQKAPDMSDALKNLSPEARQQVEAAMKKRGVGMGTEGINKVCYSKETIEQNRWAEQRSSCKTTFSSRTAASWKWHSSCPQYGSESDGEATFSSPENYVIKTSSVSKMGDASRTSHMTITGKWLSSDCGDLKPLQDKP